MENKLRARALVNERYGLALEYIANAELDQLVTRVAAALEAAERRGLQRAAQIVQDVADEHVNQDTDAFRERSSRDGPELEYRVDTSLVQPLARLYEGLTGL